MEKLGPVRGAMAQKDDDWEKWGLEELVDNLRSTQTKTLYPWWNPVHQGQVILYLGTETLIQKGKTN